MRFRPPQTISERELLMLLAGSGRAVSLTLLANWRKDGLLPPLASQGVGRGRSYYWRQARIVAQAEAAYDLLHAGQGRDAVLLDLFLAGFETPLQQFRRAWRHRNRKRESLDLRLRDVVAWPVGITALPRFAAEGSFAGLLFSSLLEVGDGIGASDGCAATIFERALRHIADGGSLGTARGDIPNLWPLMQVLGVSLAGSDLIVAATDEQLLQAQSYLSAMSPLLERCSRGLPTDTLRGELSLSLWLAENLGAPLFLFLLLQICRGRSEALDQFTRDAERLDRRLQTSPVQSGCDPLRA